MRDPLFVGIDLGTQGVRAVVMTAGGGVAARGEHALRGRRDGARHEQDPEDWWRALAGACRAALARAGAGAIRAVAIDSTSGTVALVGRDGAALSPGLMYDDARAGEQAARANEA